MVFEILILTVNKKCTLKTRMHIIKNSHIKKFDFSNYFLWYTIGGSNPGHPD